jgi:hypothetical protein
MPGQDDSPRDWADRTVGRRWDLTPDEIEAMKRERDLIAESVEDAFVDGSPNHEGAVICWYVNDEGVDDPDEDPAVSAEFLGAESYFGLDHPYWRATTRSGKVFWVIENPAMACYDGDTFDHITVAMYQHIGRNVAYAAHSAEPCPYHRSETSPQGAAYQDMVQRLRQRHSGSE